MILSLSVAKMPGKTVSISACGGNDVKTASPSVVDVAEALTPSNSFTLVGGRARRCCCGRLREGAEHLGARIDHGFMLFVKMSRTCRLDEMSTLLSVLFDP